MSIQKELIEKLILEISNMREELPNGNIIRIEQSINMIREDQKEMKKDTRTIQKRLFNPDNGLIVEVNKNTGFREERESKIQHYDGKVMQFDSLLEWKGTITKGLWVIYSALLGIVIKLLFWS